MIGQLRGRVEQLGKDNLILDVNGVGYLVRVTSHTLQNAPLGKELTLKTHLSVREDALDLYGFGSADEVVFFGLLINVSGIGPKSALAIMNLGTVPTLQSAIGQGDIAYLTRVSGIGKKNAEKIVLELRDKLGGVFESHGSLLKEDTDVLQALESLGYGRHEARESLKLIPKTASGTNDRLREALKILGKS
jgi:Holliday junction DNA helicase RuvA